MKIAIIGAGGRMGQWYCRFAVGEGLNVIAADKDADKLKILSESPLVEIMNSAEAVSKARVIFIAVPIADFENTVKEIAPHIHPGSIVMDITSIKAGPVATMHKYLKDAIVLGTHPLFGPNVNGLENQNVVLTPVNEKEKAFGREFAKFLEDRGAHVTMMDPEKHDKMMAIIQGLSHFTAIAAADALSGLGELKEMEDIATTTFKIFVNYINSVIGDDPELYAAIQMEHPEMPEIYKALTQSVEKFAGFVETKDTKSFVKRMSELKKYMGK
jgi:prephenate dehydrogenase